MKKSGGLGSVPKGLEWIGNTQPTQLDLLSTQEERVKPQLEHPIEQPQEAIVKQNSTESTQKQIQATRSTKGVSVGKTARVQKRVVTSATAGLPEGFTRATFIVRQEHIDRLKALSYVKQIPIKDLVDTAMIKYLKDKDVHTILREALDVMSDHNDMNTNFSEGISVV